MGNLCPVAGWVGRHLCLWLPALSLLSILQHCEPYQYISMLCAKFRQTPLAGRRWLHVAFFGADDVALPSVTLLTDSMYVELSSNML